MMSVLFPRLSQDVQVLLAKYDSTCLSEAVQLITGGLLPFSKEKHTWLFTAVNCIDTHISNSQSDFADKLQLAANFFAATGTDDCLKALQSAAQDFNAVCKVARGIDWVDLQDILAYMQNRINWLSATADSVPTKKTDELVLIAVTALLLVITPAFLMERYHCQHFSKVWLGRAGGYVASTPVKDTVAYMKKMSSILPDIKDLLERLAAFETQHKDDNASFDFPADIWGEHVDFQFLLQLGRLLEIVPSLHDILLKDLHDGFGKKFSEVQDLVQKEADRVDGLLTSLDWPTIPDSASLHDFICVLPGRLIQLPGRFASSS